MAAVVTVIAQLSAHPRPFHPSQLLTVTAGDPIAPYLLRLDPSFHLTVASDHYDGVYFLAMALDPLALGEAHDLIDLAAYRYGHPLWGWLAAVFSFGQAAALPWVFWFLSVASMALAAGACAVVARRAGASGWIGLISPGGPGLLFSATNALTEPLQVALICAMLLAWQTHRRRGWLLALISIALSLTKEQLILVPLALGLIELSRVFAREPVRWRSLIALGCGPAALAAWLLYARLRFFRRKSHDHCRCSDPAVLRNHRAPASRAKDCTPFGPHWPWCLSGRSDHPSADGDGDRRGAVPSVQSIEDRAHVLLDGVSLAAGRARNVPIGVPLAGKAQYFLLP